MEISGLLWPTLRDNMIGTWPRGPGLALAFWSCHNLRWCVLVELGIDTKEAVELLQLVRDSSKASEPVVTALDLMCSVYNQQPIVTFSEQLDTLLGGGVPLGKVTEFCGAPGVGKTQIWWAHCIFVLLDLASLTDLNLFLMLFCSSAVLLFLLQTDGPVFFLMSQYFRDYFHQYMIYLSDQSRLIYKEHLQMGNGGLS